jgi:hypothetical protein
MSDIPVSRFCLYCEAAPAATAYGLCPACDGISQVRRVYKKGRGRSAAWETHLLYLTQRAKQQLPLFVEGYEPPRRPILKRRKKQEDDFIPTVHHLTLPCKECDV